MITQSKATKSEELGGSVQNLHTSTGQQEKKICIDTIRKKRKLSGRESSKDVTRSCSDSAEELSRIDAIRKKRKLIGREIRNDVTHSCSDSAEKSLLNNQSTQTSIFEYDMYTFDAKKHKEYDTKLVADDLLVDIDKMLSNAVEFGEQPYIEYTKPNIVAERVCMVLVSNPKKAIVKEVIKSSSETKIQLDSIDKDHINSLFPLYKNINGITKEYDENYKKITDPNNKKILNNNFNIFTEDYTNRINLYKYMPEEILGFVGSKQFCNGQTTKIINKLAGDESSLKSIREILEEENDFLDIPSSAKLSEIYKTSAETFFADKIKDLCQIYPEMQFFPKFYCKVKKSKVKLTTKRQAYVLLGFLHVIEIILDCVLDYKIRIDQHITVNKKEGGVKKGKKNISLDFSLLTRYLIVIDDMFATFLFLLNELIPQDFNDRLEMFYQIKHRAIFEFVSTNIKSYTIDCGTIQKRRLLRMTVFCFLYVDDLVVKKGTNKDETTIFYLDVFLQEVNLPFLHTNAYDRLRDQNLNYYIKLFRIFLIYNKQKIKKCVLEKLTTINDFFKRKLQHTPIPEHAYTVDIIGGKRYHKASYLKNEKQANPSGDFYSTYNVSNIFSKEKVIMKHITVYHVVFYALSILCDQIAFCDMTNAFFYKFPLFSGRLEHEFEKNYDIICKWLNWDYSDRKKPDNECYLQYYSINQA